MANHGFITTKKNFTPKQILIDLQEINQRRFKGLLTIEDGAYGGIKEVGSFHILIQNKRLHFRKVSIYGSPLGAS